MKKLSYLLPGVAEEEEEYFVPCLVLKELNVAEFQMAPAGIIAT